MNRTKTIVEIVWDAIAERAEREGLWLMPLCDVDLEAMAHEVRDALNKELP